MDEAFTDEEDRLQLQRELLQCLWDFRNPALRLHDWLQRIRLAVLDGLFVRCRTLSDEAEVLTEFLERTEPGGPLEAMTVGQFSAQGDGSDRINLTTLHSSKGREFTVVILFDIDQGRIPRNGANERDLREARRLFYVGFTRAEREVHIVFSAHNPSRFVRELRMRLDVGE